MDTLINKMETEIANLFDVCTVTPVVVYSEVAEISPSDGKYSRERGIAILRNHDIDELLEMLRTNREPKRVLGYIEECKWRYTNTLGDY